MKKINQSNMRKVCIVVHSRANYARIKSLLIEIKKSKKLKLQLVVGASALLYRFGKVVDLIKKDGFTPVATMQCLLEGETPEAMAKSTGLAMIELSTIFNNIKPDIVLTVADRYETLATAVTARYMNICLAHTQGGECTGSIDESVRHSVTKLANLHFPSTERSKNYIIKMGEEKKNVWNTGCPSIDLIKSNLNLPKNFWEKYGGTGKRISLTEKYFVLLQHPVTTEYGQSSKQMKTTLNAIKKLNTPTVILWPNADAGNDSTSKSIREFRENNKDFKLRLLRHLPVDAYHILIYNSACLIGNSSSAIREGSYLGIPSVNIGKRQQNREFCKNVINVDHDEEKIFDAINKQVAHGKYNCSLKYGDGKAGKKIHDILIKANLDINKSLCYLNNG